MNMLDLKRWQWSLAGIAIALLLAFATGAASQAVSPSSEMSQSDFEQQLAVPRGLLESLCLYPMSDGYRLTGTLLLPNNTNVHFFLNSKNPFHAQGLLHPPARVATLKEYLDWISSQKIGVSYRYAWWESHWWSGLLGDGRWFLYALIGALVGGVIWPTGLALAQGKPLIGELFFYKQRPTPWSKPQLPPSKESLEQLDNMIAGLEQDLTSRVSGATAAGPASARKQDIPLQLDDKPLDVPLAQDAESDKHFGGQFYPTEVHGQESEQQ